MAGAIARIDGIYPAPASHELPRPHVGVAERRRQAVQYAVSQDAPRLRVVSWADFRVAHIGNAFLERPAKTFHCLQIQDSFDIPASFATEVTLAAPLQPAKGAR
jgi:hypothetical protein